MDLIQTFTLPAKIQAFPAQAIDELTIVARQQGLHLQSQPYLRGTQAEAEGLRHHGMPAQARSEFFTHVKITPRPRLSGGIILPWPMVLGGATVLVTLSGSLP